jgi:hypothetical protein
LIIVTQIMKSVIVTNIATVTIFIFFAYSSSLQMK